MRGTEMDIMRTEVSRPTPVRRLPFYLGLIVLLSCTFGCAPSPSRGDGVQNSSLELTDETISERINDTRVWDVPEENGTGEPIHWSFDEDEPKEIAVVEKQIDDGRATIILDVKTQSSPRSSNQRRLAGQIRTEWQLRTGWVLRRWEIVRTDNISMKYRNLPKQPPPPPPQNSNSGEPQPRP